MIRSRSKDSRENDKKHTFSPFAAKGPVGTASASESTASNTSPSSAASSSSVQALERLGCFKHVVSSRSGSLSLYEDGEGHLVAIDPRRFC